MISSSLVSVGFLPPSLLLPPLAGHRRWPLMISSSLISVGFLLVSTLTAFLRNSLFSPAHFLPNSRESLLCEWALYRTVSVAPVGERDTASVPCVGGTLCSCDSTGS